MLIKHSDLRAVLMNKLCGEGSLIRVPKGAEYSAEDATNVLLHAATSSSDSIEAAVQDLQAMHPISRIPCADTVHNYMKANDVGEMLSFVIMTHCFLSLYKRFLLLQRTHHGPCYSLKTLVMQVSKPF